MKTILALAACASLFALASAVEASPASKTQTPAEAQKPPALTTSSPDRGVLFAPEAVSSDGSVTVEGQRIDYRAIAGTIVVHPKDWDDSATIEQAAPKEEPAGKEEKELGDENNPKAEASMFYVAYFKKGVPSADRPITFIYNGGPGSSSVWLHMGAFGPRRVVTADDSHTPAAPYHLVDNAYSLLDVSDLVFIDAPGTGFSRIAGKDKEKAFFGVDADAHAFDQFILGFLSKYGRWNSPKYLFGESYGTPRSAVLVNELETSDDVDFNGVILLSEILNFDLSADGPELNPGTEEPYIVALPTYAATAWYHNLIPGGRPADLEAFLKEVEDFATGDYAHALLAGSQLDPAQRQAIAERLSHYTGLPADYILKANLRIDGGEFEKTLQDRADLTTGRLDTRFSGPSLDPLSKEAEYDPQSAAISSAYVSLFNDYVRKTLGFGDGRIFKPEINVFKYWDYNHQPPSADHPAEGIVNVMPDIANALKQNPSLKVMVAGGYYDLATPFYEGWYEMHHLQIPGKLMSNIEFHYYPSGHMVYAHEASLKTLHDDAAAFIRKTDNLGQ
ncbi:MAG TPA: peptidase S10 [Caulobacteraceae bacterium]|jgi:carboxypeptidase C (cathepsin A)